MCSYHAPRLLASLFIVSLLSACSSGDSSPPVTGGTTVPGETFIPCTMGSGNITVTGQMTFDRVWHSSVVGMTGGGLDFGNITQEPIRGAVVEAVCNGIVSTATTDSSGNYSISVPANSQDVAVRVKAQMLQVGAPAWNYSVVDNSNSQALYAMSSSPFDTDTLDQTKNLNAASGWTGSSYTETRAAGPFAIIDSVYDAHQLVLTEEPAAVFPELKINWNPNNTEGTYYNGSEIFVLGATNDTDEYDYHVIIHEWGHYFQDKFSRDDSLGGSHGGSDVLDIRVAFSEGFGNAFSAIVSTDSLYRDSIGLSSNNALSFDLESNNCSNDGWFSECSVQSIFYDLFDATNDGADVVALGFSPLYDVLHSNMPGTNGFTSIFSLISPLKSNVPASASDIDALVSAQTIDTIADQFGSTESNSIDATNKIPVYATTAGILCNTKEHGEYNKLGNYRFVSVTGSGASVTFNASRTSGIVSADPDLKLYLNGEQIALVETTTVNTESLTATLQAGQTYILELYEYSYTDLNADAGISETCFNVTW